MLLALNKDLLNEDPLFIMVPNGNVSKRTDHTYKLIFSNFIQKNILKFIL